MKTEEEEAVVEEETNLDVDTAVRTEDDDEENSDSEKVNTAPDALVKTNEDEEDEALEEESEKEAKVNPSAANSQARIHASDRIAIALRVSFILVEALQSIRAVNRALAPC